MDTLYYNMGDTILTINYPIDSSGHYCIESEHDQEIGHLFLDNDKDTGRPAWKGTTQEVDHIAAELGDFIENAEM